MKLPDERRAVGSRLLTVAGFFGVVALALVVLVALTISFWWVFTGDALLVPSWVGRLFVGMLLVALVAGVAGGWLLEREDG